MDADCCRLIGGWISEPARLGRIRCRLCERCRDGTQARGGWSWSAVRNAVRLRLRCGRAEVDWRLESGDKQMKRWNSGTQNDGFIAPVNY